ncbi:MAG: PfkB family carbohydrate kinase [Planctomycetia bacterium]|jgi:sulfofructose kinase
MEKQKHVGILGIGVVAVDDVLYVERYPEADQKVRVLRRRRCLGGQAGRALVTVARLGGVAQYAGTLWHDDLSLIVLKRFDVEGVSAAHAVFREDAKPCHSTIVVDENSHTRTIFGHVTGYFGPDPQLPSEEVISGASVLLIDHHGVEGSLRAARIARATGVPVVADFERNTGGPFDELMEQIDHMVFPYGFVKREGYDNGKGPEEAVRQLLQKYGATVVITCGADGVWYAEPNTPEPRHFKAFEITPFDTNGCGDIFHGAYCVALSEGLDLHERVGFATAAAALGATQLRDSQNVPHRVTVDRFLEDAG